MQRDAEQIVIVGGGPIGLTTALLLAQASYRVTVIEGRAASAARADRRLLALSRGTWQVLAPLLDQVPPHARIDTVIVSSAGEFGRTRIDSTDAESGFSTAATAAPATATGSSGSSAGSTPSLGVTMHYGALCEALEHAVASAPLRDQISVRRPARATSVAQRHDAVSVTLDDGSSLEAALALYAEGAPRPQESEPGSAQGSTPRSTQGAQPESDAWALLADVQLSGPAPGTAFERFTREGPLALLPAVTTQGHGWSLVWCSGAAGAHQRRALSDADFVAALQAAIGGRSAQVVSAGPRHAVQLAPQLRASIAEHRVAWLGNAAQTLHPVAGQGFNLGVRDARTLVDALRSHRADGTTDVPAALLDYARRRGTDRRLIAGITRLLPALFATRAWPLALGRSAGLTLLDLTPPLRRQWAHLLMFGVRG